MHETSSVAFPCLAVSHYPSFIQVNPMSKKENTSWIKMIMKIQ